MIFQKRFRDRGIIIIDIMIALALGALFVCILGTSSESAKNTYEKAKRRSILLTAYNNAIDGKLAQPDTGMIVSDVTNLFGNDLLERKIHVTYMGGDLDMRSVHSKEQDNLGMVRGSPLCSVNHMQDLYGNRLRESIRRLDLPISPTLPLTDLEVRNGTAYVSADSNIVSDPDIFIFDIRDVGKVEMMSSLNTGPGIVSFALAGRRIFAGTGSTIGQLHVIRIIGLAQMSLEKKYQLPLPYATATPAVASVVAWSDNKLYIGTEKWSGDELNIIDASDPVNAKKIGGLEIGSKVNDILIRKEPSGDIIYTASSGANQLVASQVIDSADNSTITIVSDNFSPSGSGRQDGKVIHIFEDGLYFGRTSGGYDIPADHEVFSFFGDGLSGLIPSISENIPGGVYGMISDRDNLFISTRQIDSELSVYGKDMSSGKVSSFSLPILPQTMTCDRNKIYILSHNGPYIYEISYQ